MRVLNVILAPPRTFGPTLRTNCLLDLAVLPNLGFIFRPLGIRLSPFALGCLNTTSAPVLSQEIKRKETNPITRTMPLLSEVDLMSTPGPIAKDRILMILIIPTFLGTMMSAREVNRQEPLLDRVVLALTPDRPLSPITTPPTILVRVECRLVLVIVPTVPLTDTLLVPRTLQLNLEVFPAEPLVVVHLILGVAMTPTTPMTRTTLDEALLMIVMVLPGLNVEEYPTTLTATVLLMVVMDLLGLSAEEYITSVGTTLVS